VVSRALLEGLGHLGGEFVGLPARLLERSSPIAGHANVDPVALDREVLDHDHRNLHRRLRPMRLGGVKAAGQEGKATDPGDEEERPPVRDHLAISGADDTAVGEASPPSGDSSLDAQSGQGRPERQRSTHSGSRT